MHSGCGCSSRGDSGATTQVGALERPRYSPGLVLEASDLTTAVDYTRDLNRLLFKSLFGCGVICGLDVSVKTDCDLIVTVNPGLALDGCGDPINLTGQAKIALGKKTGVLLAEGAKAPDVTDFWVIACYKEKSCAPRALVCDGDDLDVGTQATRVRSAVEISVVFEPPACACGCGTFAKAPKSADLDRLALLNQECQARRGDRSTAGTNELLVKRSVFGECDGPCHDAHYTDPSCPVDCGCGTACSCGCCVLLAWVHWFPGSDFSYWQPLHHGVRRFVRPALIPDPKWDFSKVAPQAAEVSLAPGDANRIRTLVANTVRAHGGDISTLDSAAIAKAVSAEVMRISPEMIKTAKANSPNPVKPD